MLNNKEKLRVVSDLLSAGFELVDQDYQLPAILPDGRELLKVDGQVLVLKKEEHERRLALAFAQAKNLKSTMKDQELPDFCTMIVGGQLCGGVVSVTGVCRSSMLGKSGVTQIITCEDCGAVVAVMARHK